MTPPSPPQRLLLATTALILLAAATCLPTPPSAHAFKPAAGIDGMFVFGSSLVDNGNNNFFPLSLSKANYPPYGVDFPGGPTGRYTNGKNVPDLLCDKLGLPLLPRSRDPVIAGGGGELIIHGVDFASGASGIRDETGAIAGQVINFNQQMRDFEETVLPKLENFTGYSRKEILPKYLILVGVGGNDYTLNYFLNLTDPRPSLNYFTSDLISSLSAKVQVIFLFQSIE
ncbi:GDSL esterase/lipase At5g08460 [Linum grandiflorum]